jgi:hypothetical protein
MVIRAVVVLVMAAVMISMAVVMIVIASFLAMVVMAALGVIGSSSSLGFLDVGVAVCHLYQLTDGRRPLMVELSTKLLVLEPLGECSDSLTITNVRDGIPSLREAPDEIVQGLPEGQMKLLQIILGA